MKVFAYLQKIGRSLMLPIATLPAAALFLRLGAPDVLGKILAPDIANIIFRLGDVMFGNLNMIFALGVAIGISDDQHGAAAIAGFIMYYCINTVGGHAAKAVGTVTVEAGAAVKALNTGALGGIFAGIFGGEIYNKFKNTNLPKALAFFSGRRMVPMMTLFVGFFVALVFGFVWPTLEGWLDAFGRWIYSQPKPVAAGTHVVFNRLMLPFGLHHILNSLVWFQINGGDLNNFFKTPQVAGSGIFMTGFFPLMMFGLPAVGAAMAMAAKKERRKEIVIMMSTLAGVAFLTGITEPLEFSFLFLSPLLFLLYAVLSGIVAAITIASGALTGFGFSAGFIDLMLNWGISTNPLYIVLIGVVIAPIYYFLFYFLIKKFNLMTPGREDGEAVTMDTSKATSKDEKEWDVQGFIVAFGGKENIKSVQNCATRLRLELVDSKKLNEPKLKKLGSFGVMKTKTTAQIIIGVEVPKLSDALKKALK